MFFRCSLFSFNPLSFSAAPLAGLALKKNRFAPQAQMPNFRSAGAEIFDSEKKYRQKRESRRRRKKTAFCHCWTYFSYVIFGLEPNIQRSPGQARG